MTINLDDKDQFGVPWRKSFVPEHDIVTLIHSLGLTVEEASQRRKAGNLPEEILAAWNQYDALNKERFLAKDNNND